LVEVHKSDATPNFSQQGAAVGKTKGRKARKKADEKPAPSEVEAGGDDQEKPAPKKAPRKRKTASATAPGEPSGGSENVGKRARRSRPTSKADKEPITYCTMHLFFGDL